MQQWGLSLINPRFKNLEIKMRITLESDYALKIVTALAGCQDVTDAKTLSQETAVTQRFTLKILHKLVLGGIVESYKGAKGGYRLKQKPSDITLKSVIELIDGPIAIARCLDSDGSCALNHNTADCIYYHIFDSISNQVAERLAAITIDDVLKKTNNTNS